MITSENIIHNINKYCFNFSFCFEKVKVCFVQIKKKIVIVYSIVLKMPLINRTDRVIKTSNVQTSVSCFKNLNPDQVAIHSSPNYAHVCDLF